MGQSELLKYKTETYRDKTRHSVNARAISIKTPQGLGGDDGKMVLLLGTISKFIESCYFSFDINTHQVNSARSITWQNDLESLLFLSRSDCKLEVKNIDVTIATSQITLQDPNASETEKEAAEMLLARGKWTSLFFLTGKRMNEMQNNPTMHSTLVASSGPMPSTATD